MFSGLRTLLFFTGAALAAGFYGNQSHIDWKTAGTEHFQFIYPAEYSEHASAVATYAEAVYDSVVNRYNKPLPRISAVLNNALFSNGAAIPAENSINLWLTNWDFKIRSSHGWVADVVTHEFSHLVSIESASKLPPNLYGFQFSYTDYYNERTISDFATMLPFTLQPLWFAEGTAQFESSRMGFDAWDTHRDMLLRTAALNDDLMPLTYMHEFSDNSLEAELGPYTQGFSLVRYIAEKYGEDAIPKIWKELSKPYRVTLSGALEKVLGVSEDNLYEAWKKDITEHYQAQKDSLGPLVEGTKMTENAFWQDFPVVAGGNLYGVSNFGGAWFDGAVFKMPVSETRDTVAGVEIGNIAIEKDASDSADTNLIDISDYAKSGFRAKKPWFDKGIDVYEDSLRGPILAYVSFKNRDRNGRAHFDIALSDTSKNEHFLTHLANAVFPAFDPNGKFLVFARRDGESTRFILSKVPFNADFGELSAEDPVDLYVPDGKLRYFNIYSPKVSPDGKRILFGFFDDVHRGLAIIDSDGKNFKTVSDTLFDERDGNWLSNEKIVFASNRNGIFNLIEKDLATGAERPLTNVVGGAFTPALGHDTLYFTQYDQDGFSLYKQPYRDAGPDSVTIDSIIVTYRDSTVTVPDTLWSVCPPEDTLCTPEAVLAERDSTFQIEMRDTLKVKVAASSLTGAQIAQSPTGAQVADSAKKTPTPIVLRGSPLRPEKKFTPLESRELAGGEQDYHPIPFIPLFVPLLSFNENAPDLTVFGEGQRKAKLGLLALLSDPLKKNVVQLGLLLELGKGFDYINADGLNPEQEKEFFVSWLNRSTPLDLGINYSYANYTSRDTVRYEDVRAHGGDSLGFNHYAISQQAVAGMAGYSLFKSIDTLQVALGYDWADFNLYEDDFSWTYHKRISTLATFGLYGDHEGEDGSGISGQGNGAVVTYQYSNSDLYRPGTFAESFYVTESGSIKPRYRNFNIHQVDLNLYGSIQSPLTGARLAAGGKLGGIFNWSTDAKEDTLDSYYYNAVFLEGYPYVRSNESYTRSGTKTAIAEIHYLFPVYDDWRKRLWIFSTRDLYLDVFAQAGAAWNGKWNNSDNFTKHGFWDRSAGFGIRWSNKVFESIPVDISLTFARALDRIGEEDGVGYKLNPIDLPLLPKRFAPTRIRFNLGMGFLNSWQ